MPEINYLSYEFILIVVGILILWDLILHLIWHIPSFIKKRRNAKFKTNALEENNFMEPPLIVSEVPPEKIICPICNKIKIKGNKTMCDKCFKNQLNQMEDKNV